MYAPTRARCASSAAIGFMSQPPARPGDERQERGTPLEGSPSPIEHLFPSTQWVWKHVEIRPPARAIGPAERSESFRLRLHRRGMRRPLPCVIRFRGGPELWVQIEARGRVWRFTGDTALYDALSVMSQTGTLSP